MRGRIVVDFEEIPEDCYQCDQPDEYGYCGWVDKYIDHCSEIGKRYPTCPIEPCEERNKKVLFEDIGYDSFHNVNVYACICPSCGLHIIEFTDDEVDLYCDTDDPEVMFKSSMVHHGYEGLNSFCNRCGQRLDWGNYDNE